MYALYCPIIASGVLHCVWNDPVKLNLGVI